MSKRFGYESLTVSKRYEVEIEAIEETFFDPDTGQSSRIEIERKYPVFSGAEQKWEADRGLYRKFVRIDPDGDSAAKRFLRFENAYGPLHNLKGPSPYLAAQLAFSPSGLDAVRIFREFYRQWNALAKDESHQKKSFSVLLDKRSAKSRMAERSRLDAILRSKREVLIEEFRVQLGIQSPNQDDLDPWSPKFDSLLAFMFYDLIASSGRELISQECEGCGESFQHHKRVKYCPDRHCKVTAQRIRNRALVDEAKSFEKSIRIE